MAKSKPKVIKGTHLTVTILENGQTELVWDDEALLKEVQDAILSASLAEPAKPKSTRKPKKA